MRKLPKALKKYCPPMTLKEEALLSMYWKVFRSCLYPKGEDADEDLTEEERHRLAKRYLGELFAVPESEWGQFMKNNKVSPQSELNRFLASKQGKAVLNAHLKRSTKPKPQKPKPVPMAKVLIRRQTEGGSGAPTQILLVPAKKGQ